MKQIFLDEYLEENRGEYARQRLKLMGRRRCTPSRRPRSQEKREVLLRLDMARRKSWLAGGKLEVLGTRKYRLSLDRLPVPPPMPSKKSRKIQDSAEWTEFPWNRSICEAIRKKAVIRFVYHGLPRIVEPQAHGVSTAGNEVLRGVQTGGESLSKFDFGRLYEISQMQEIAETGEIFSRPRPGFNPQDKGMIYVHCHLEPA